MRSPQVPVHWTIDVARGRHRSRPGPVQPTKSPVQHPRLFVIRLSPKLLGAPAALALLVAPSAQAATRIAAPTGAGAACTQDAPCAVADAVSGAAAGDDIVLAPGDYTVI